MTNCFLQRASPTPYAEPIVGILDVKYLNESGDVVEAKNYTDLQTLGYTGGIWLESDVDWPCRFFSRSCDSLDITQLLTTATKQQRYTSNPYLSNLSNGSNVTPASPLPSRGWENAQTMWASDPQEHRLCILS